MQQNLAAQYLRQKLVEQLLGSLGDPPTGVILLRYIQTSDEGLLLPLVAGPSG